MGHTDEQFCWDQVLRIHPVYKVTHFFVPRKISGSTLGLYALFSALEETVSYYTDESVPMAKLAWWRQELLGTQSSKSQHPIVRQLNQCRANWLQFEENIAGLLDTTVERLNDNLPPDLNSLKALCERVGRYSTLLELGLSGELNTVDSELRAINTLNGLVQLIRESSRGHTTAFWWVPLSLLARHHVTRSELNSSRKIDNGKALLADLPSIYQDWCDKETQQDETGATERRANKYQRHCRIHAAFHLRQLRESSVKYPNELNKLFSQVRVGDVWFAWRSARAIVT